VTREPIGLIAGNGQFPIMFARSAQQQGRCVVAVAHEGETLPEIEKVADRVTWVKLGQLGKTIKAFKSAGVAEAVMCGGVTKSKMFAHVRPDFRGATFWFKQKHRHDDSMLRALAREFEEEGILIRESTLYVPQLIADPGCYTRRKPSKQEQQDVNVGLRLAKQIGELDIGQAIVVRDGAVVAVEAMEGTDAMIRRAGKLARRNAVVVKVAKPGQDLRFDVPSVGLGTIQVMADAGCSVLAVEAGKTLIFERERMVREADALNICILGCESPEDMFKEI